MKLLITTLLILVVGLIVCTWRISKFKKRPRPKMAEKKQCDIKEILDMFHQELNLACQSFYAWKSIHNLAAAENEIFKSINSNALSWNLILHSLQATFFITIGRIFDTDHKSFSVHKVFRCCKENIQQFNKENLRKRKLGEATEPPDWLDEYIEKAYEAKKADFKNLKKEVTVVKKTYEDIYRPIRHKIFAHKDSDYISDTSGLFQETSIEQAEQILSSLHQAKMVIQSLYDNGRLTTTDSWKFNEEKYVRQDVESLLKKIAKK